MPGQDDHGRAPRATQWQLARPTAEVPDDGPAIVHAARSLRGMADDERRSAAYARSAPVGRDEDDADAGGRAEERGTGAATVRERMAEQHEAVAGRYDQSRGDHSTSRRR